MRPITAKHARSKQILSALKDHGPLTAIGLLGTIRPPMKIRRLQDSLVRLKNKGLVGLKYEAVLGSQRPVYKLKQTDVARRAVAELLGCDDKSLRQPYFNHREQIHNDALAILASNLQSTLPKAKVIRDFQILLSPEDLWITGGDNLKPELLPDLLVKFSLPDLKWPLSIGVELELERKSDRLLIHKLRGYAAKSKIDGVIYFCSEPRISRAILTNFNKYVAKWARRISAYPDSFILLTDIHSIGTEMKSKMFSTCGQPVSLEEWITSLSANRSRTPA